MAPNSSQRAAACAECPLSPRHRRRAFDDAGGAKWSQAPARYLLLDGKGVFILPILAEALPSPQKIAALNAGMAGGRRATVLSGLGGLYGLFDLERGSDGFNTGFAFPEVLRAILREFHGGNSAGARRIFTRFLPLLVFEQQPGVAIRKDILRRRGLLTSNRVRHPGATIDPATATQLGVLLEVTFAGADILRVLEINA